MGKSPINGDDGKRFQRLEVFPVGEKGGVWGGAVQICRFWGSKWVLRRCKKHCKFQ